MMSREGHVASSFSIVDILVGIFNYQIKIYGQAKVDNLVLSKGHAVFALYAAMAEYGLLFTESEDAICKNNSPMIGHVPVLPELGLNYGTGSLGQGLSYAIGASYRERTKDFNPEYFVILGDGEMNEGSCWEAILLLKKFELPLRVFIDLNLSSERALPVKNFIHSIVENFDHVIVDGHDPDLLVQSLSRCNKDKPVFYICNTLKGYPLVELSSPIWHHKSPSPDEFGSFINKLETFFQ